MKRLLAYLSIIIGLGLVLNVNSYSEVYCVDTKIDERIKNFKPDYLTRENQFFYYSGYSTVCIGSYKKVKAKKYNHLKNLFNKEILKISSTDDKVESEFGSQLILDDTDRNIEKLYRNILTSDRFLKKNKYLKLSKKKKISGKKNEIIVLAVYFNYEKELLRLTNNPEINDIDIQAWSWASSNRNLDWKEIYGYAMGSLNTKAASKCYKKALKLKLEGGECI